MVEIELGGRTVRLKGAAYTAIAYSEAFGGDVWDALVALEKKGRVPVLEVLRCAWALAKTADMAAGVQTTPDFGAWCLSLGQVNAASVLRPVHDELADGVIFRTEEQKPDGAPGRARKARRDPEVA